MAGTIPQKVSATKALTGQQHYAGTLAAAQLPRLKAVAEAGEVEVDLAAERDRRGAWLRGSIRGRLKLKCQRGLHPFDWDCDLPVELRLVQTEAEEARLLKETEPYLVQDDVLPLREMIEDEVLLALPMMPRCADEGCARKSGAKSGL